MLVVRGDDVTAVSLAHVDEIDLQGPFLLDFGFLDDIIEMDSVMKKLEEVLNKGYKICDWVIYMDSR